MKSIRLTEDEEIAVEEKIKRLSLQIFKKKDTTRSMNKNEYAITIVNTRTYEADTYSGLNIILKRRSETNDYSGVIGGSRNESNTYQLAIEDRKGNRYIGSGEEIFSYVDSKLGKKVSPSSQQKSKRRTLVEKLIDKISK